MTARSIRRAQERKTKKSARKESLAAAQSHEIQSPAERIDFVPEPICAPAQVATDALLEPTTCSEARLAANRANAAFSTGPRTVQGRSVSSLNAVKTGLTGRTVLLPSDDVDAYVEHVTRYTHELNPVGARESVLVQSIADADWRIMRVAALEMAIFARGRSEFADKFEHEELRTRPGLIDLETFLVYGKDLRNLQLQEGRLRRQREKDLVELRKVQDERIAEEKAQLADAAKLYLAARHDRRPFDPADHGFEFSIDDVLAYLNGVRAAEIAAATLKKGVIPSVKAAA